jgi:hypothetical protein
VRRCALAHWMKRITDEIERHTKILVTPEARR